MSLEDWTEVEVHEIAFGAHAGQLWTGKNPSGKWDWYHPDFRNTEGSLGQTRGDALQAGTEELHAHLVKR